MYGYTHTHFNLTVWLPKQDLNKYSNIKHANMNGGSLRGPTPKQSTTFNRENIVFHRDEPNWIR